MSARSFLSLAVVLAGGAGLRAADDVEQPYHLRIVVQVGAHRLLTRDFRDALQRELRDEFRDALGKLDKVEVRVIDRGPGIQRADRERAFEPFQRLGDTDNTTGLGLDL